MTKKRRSLLWQFFIPLLAMALITPWSNTLDKTVSNFFYHHDRFTSHPFLDFIYRYGFMPAWLLAGAAAFILVSAFFSFRFRRWRRAAIFLLTTLAIGPGFLVHAVLKDHWGRPRPKQVIEYGGKQLFRAYYQPNLIGQPEPSKSFPSGHASMGFYFFSLAFLGKHYKSKKIFYVGIFIALALGAILSFTRLAQGGHFLSDTIASALIMWLTTLVNYFLIFKLYGHGYTPFRRSI